jgi:magnesium transporter
MDDEQQPIEPLERAIEQGDVPELQARLEAVRVEDVAYVLHRLEPESQAKMLELLSEDHADVGAGLLEHMQDQEAARLISVLPPSAAAAIVEEMDSDDRADVLGEVNTRHTQEILAELDPADAQEVRDLVQYPAETAGGLMITEYLSYPQNSSIRAVLDDMRSNAERYARYDVQYVYVTDDDGKLVGVIRLRDLVLTPGDRALSSIMLKNPTHVRVTDEQRELGAFFDAHGYFAAPVVDENGVLRGVVRRAAVEEAHAEKADRALLQFGGIIGGDELRSMPTVSRVTRRLAFLCPNILLNLIAASVVAFYEPTIAAVTALAIFLPMLSDMSGCAGNQAVAVSIRELSLGLIRPHEVRRTVAKEVVLGVVNGVVLGTLIGLIAWVMRGQQWPLIGFVVGGAMALNSVVAVLVGGSVPLLLKRVGVDPALAASPILTTFTDLCGFFLTLRLATALLL